MPYRWTAAQLYLEYAGVRVYCVYKDDLLENGPRTYWYGWAPDGSDSGPCFDVRTLPNAGLHDLESDAGRKSAIRHAIRKRWLTPPHPMNTKERDMNEEFPEAPSDPHADASTCPPGQAVEGFWLALLVALGSWLGGRTGEALWERGKDLFADDDEEGDE